MPPMLEVQSALRSEGMRLRSSAIFRKLAAIANAVNFTLKLPEAFLFFLGPVLTCFIQLFVNSYLKFTRLT